MLVLPAVYPAQSPLFVEMESFGRPDGLDGVGGVGGVGGLANGAKADKPDKAPRSAGQEYNLLFFS